MTHTKNWFDRQDDVIPAHECIWGTKQTKRACHLWCANHFQRLMKRIKRLKYLLKDDSEIGKPQILVCGECKHHPTQKELEQIKRYKSNNLGPVVTKEESLKIALWFMSLPPRYGHDNEAL